MIHESSKKLAESMREVQPGLLRRENKPDAIMFEVPPGHTVVFKLDGNYSFPLGVRDPGDTQSMGFKCPKCTAMVRRTKPTIKRKAFSCKCLSMGVHHTEDVSFLDCAEAWKFLIDTVVYKDSLSQAS